MWGQDEGHEKACSSGDEDDDLSADGVSIAEVPQERAVKETTSSRVGRMVRPPRRFEDYSLG